MARSKTIQNYSSEAELCVQFAHFAQIAGWVVYPETEGWDMLLVRKADGCQVGIQAKLEPVIDVMLQACRTQGTYYSSGPDYRAVLIGSSGPRLGTLRAVAPYMGIAVIIGRGAGDLNDAGKLRIDGVMQEAFIPALPTQKTEAMEWGRDDWFEEIPIRRHKLPDYIPDVAAGVAAPRQLTSWKIKAIKICILLKRRGFVTRADFRTLSIDHKRWVIGANAWLAPDPPRGYKLRDGDKMIDQFAAEHPRNFKEIEADYALWSAALQALSQDKML